MVGLDQFSLRNSLDWLLYAGFALQVGVSIIIDLSGALSANLQLRVFPGFVVVAVFLLAKGLLKGYAIIKQKAVVYAIVSALFLILVAWFPVAGLLKASNEPLLSNQWMIYSESETSALDWSVLHLEHSEIWTGIDSRIRDAYVIKHDIKNNNIFRSFDHYIGVRTLVLTEQDQLRAERTGFSLPPVFDWMLVYDNGEAKVFKKPPTTPFQR
jgi:hypothetical protein